MEKGKLLLAYLDRLIALKSLPDGRVPERWIGECVEAIRAELGLIRPTTVFDVDAMIVQLRDSSVQEEVKRIIGNAMAEALGNNG